MRRWNHTETRLKITIHFINYFVCIFYFLYYINNSEAKFIDIIIIILSKGITIGYNNGLTLSHSLIVMY